MTFAEAFRAAIAGKRIRREWWNPAAYATATDAGHLVCWPDMRHWSGPWEPTIDDVEATDWQAEDLNAPVEIVVDEL